MLGRRRGINLSVEKLGRGRTRDSTKHCRWGTISALTTSYANQDKKGTSTLLRRHLSVWHTAPSDPLCWTWSQLPFSPMHAQVQMILKRSPKEASSGNPFPLFRPSQSLVGNGAGSFRKHRYCTPRHSICRKYSLVLNVIRPKGPVEAGLQYTRR